MNKLQVEVEVEVLCDLSIKAAMGFPLIISPDGKDEYQPETEAFAKWKWANRGLIIAGLPRLNVSDCVPGWLSQEHLDIISLNDID